MNPDLPAPTLDPSDLTDVTYYPAYGVLDLGIDIHQSSTATCNREQILDSEGNPPSPYGILEGMGGGYELPVREGTSTTWTIRYYQGNPQGRSPWSNALVVQIPAPPPELFARQTTETPCASGVCDYIFTTTWCQGARNLGDNSVCYLHRIVTVSTVP